MEVVKILEKPSVVDWDYDEEADVLYRHSVNPAKPKVLILDRESFFDTIRIVEKSSDLP